MHNLMLSTLSILALLMYPLSLSAQVTMTPSADFDDDGVVGFTDFLLFVDVFGSREGQENYDAKYDLDGNGEISFSDFLIFVDNFGEKISPQVTIPDANLRVVIEDSLGKASGASITQAEMATLTSLEARNAKIRDLTGLEFATRLTSLDFGDERVEGLYVNSNSISDFSPLSGLTNLESLNLANNSISDIAPLSGLTNLESLNLANNSNSDIAPLSGVIYLTVLNLSRNGISDVSALSGLTNLEGLSIYNNNISDRGLTGLEFAVHLRYLYLSNNSISDISPLSSLANLERLVLDNNAISDIAPLVANMGLGSGDLVDVSNNPLSATSINTHIPALQSRGVSVSFGASKPAVGEQERDISHIERGETDDYMYRRQMEEEMHRIRQKLSLPTKTGM